MNGNIIIKSFPNGISVKLSDEPDFQKILQDTRKSFEKSASFFKNASVVLQFEGRTLSDAETEALTIAILEVCKLNIICVICKNADENIYFSKLLDEIKSKSPKEEKNTKEEDTALINNSHFQFYKGCLKDGVSLETEGNVIIFGDVQKGSAVFSKGNVIVLGTIYGTVFAGKKGDNKRFIAALGYAPENLKIGSIKYQKEKKDLFTKNKKQPKLAFIKNDKFMFSDLDFTKELPEYNI